jgi:NTE family protein
MGKEVYQMDKPKIALVLGGGGARGSAHIGVLEVLLENGIDIDMIVGCSAGSIVGALYCRNKDLGQIKTIIKSIKTQDLLNFSPYIKLQHSIIPKGFSSGKKLYSFIKKAIDDTPIENFDTQFIAVSCDMRTGKTVPFDSGDASLAVQASCALPPLYAPVELDGKLLVDGGVVQPLPVQVARSYGADIVIAVDISNIGPEYEQFNFFNTMIKTINLQYYSLCQTQAKEADLCIKPMLDEYHLLDTKHVENMYLQGKIATQSKIGQLKALLSANQNETLGGFGMIKQMWRNRKSKA